MIFDLVGMYDLIGHFVYFASHGGFSYGIDGPLVPLARLRAIYSTSWKAFGSKV